MVLQNKYKARASRRYNKTHSGETLNTDKSKQQHKQRSSFSETRDDESAESESDSEEDEDEDPNFPSLAKASNPEASTSTSVEKEDPTNPSTGKYARRKLGESRLAMMERLEAAKDPRLEAEEEPEAEVDLSSLLAKVAALGESGASQAGVAQEIAHFRAAHETASDVEQDIDHSLAWLHEKERQRQKAKGRGGADEPNKAAAIETIDLNSAEVEAMKKDKEKAEAVRTLKARFQGRDLGERERRTAKSSSAPSLNIGPKSSSSSNGSTGSASTLTAKPTHSDNRNATTYLSADVGQSLDKTRQSSAKSDTGSTKSERCSFSTSFGRARGSSQSSRSPLTGSTNTFFRSDSSSSPTSTTDGIDGFLKSLNDRSVFSGRDESIFTLNSGRGSGSNSPSNASRYPTSAHASFHHHRQQLPAQTIRSSPGELGRMENFLDTMLG